MILAAYALAQVRVVAPSSHPYLWMNVGGASALAVAALMERQWGFLLLESAWALFAAVGLVAKLHPRRTEAL